MNRRRPLRGGCAAAVVALWAVAAGAQPAFQDLVDATPSGETLRPPPGIYAGPVVIRKPLRIEGEGRVIIDAGGSGSVVKLLSSGVVLRGLHLRNSGANHDTLDAGIQVRGDDNLIVDNVIEDCLFGIDMQRSNRNQVRGNRIRSKPFDLGLRGDALRLWYSFDNEIIGNDIADVRDVVVWYSARNLIAENTVVGSRYALHFMYAAENRVERNRYDRNMVGVFLMYSNGVELRNNRISGAVGPTGMGIGFKESSQVLVQENAIIYCARGIYLDVSPYEPDTINRFIANRIAYNGVGVVFHNDWHSNVFRDNDFEGNFTQVGVRGGGGATRHVWENNRWDDYQGFDRNRDGRGDTPYQLNAYSDRIWMQVPAAAFFRGSPLFEVIDFLDRLAPFMEPTLIVRDEEPRLAVSE